MNTFHALKYLYLDRNKFGRCLKKSYLSGRCYLPRSKLPIFTVLRDRVRPRPESRRRRVSHGSVAAVAVVAVAVAVVAVAVAGVSSYLLFAGCGVAMQIQRCTTRGGRFRIVPHT